MSGDQKIAGLILAAGLSSRFGSKNKLLRDFHGIPMIRAVTILAKKAGIKLLFVVTGHEHELIEKELNVKEHTIVRNKNYAAGIGGSISCGINALPKIVDGVIVMLGDMPEIKPKTINSLRESFDSNSKKDICVPTLDGRPGHPVFFGRSHFEKLRRLKGDKGAWRIIKSSWSSVKWVETSDKGVIIDYDK